MGALSISYRLPDLKPMPFESSARWVAAYDLLGISVCPCQRPIPESCHHAETLSGEERACVYRAEQVQLSVDTEGTADVRLQREAVIRDQERDIIGLWPLWSWSGWILAMRRRVRRSPGSLVSVKGASDLQVADL